MSKREDRGTGTLPARSDPTCRRNGRPGWRAGILAVAVTAGLVAGLGCRAGVTRGEILYADALEQLALGDSAQALALLESASYELPKNAAIRYLRGELLARQGTIESRAAAETELREAVDLQPSHAAYAAALGEVLHEQGFHHDSQASLRRALQLDPRLGRAWYTLGLELQAEFVEDPTAALRDSTIGCFARALAADSTNADARYRYAYLLLTRGQPFGARSVARGGLRDDPCAIRFGVLLTAIEFRSDRMAAAQRMLDSTLACMRPAERDSLLLPRALMHPDSIFCDRCTVSEADSALAQYWWGLDPTPATRINERLLEHIARLVDADFYFEVPRLHLAGHDTDRGEIYMRYGKPDLMWRDIDANVRTWRWAYADIGEEGEEFVFHDTYLNGKYVRARRGAMSDFSRKDALELEPERSLFRSGPQAPGWKQVARVFRGEAGLTAMELAFAFDDVPEVDSVRVELAARTGPGAPLATRTVEIAAADLYAPGGGRRIGRVRFEVPSRELEVGIDVQAVAPRSRPGARRRLAWAAAGRDTLHRFEADPTAFGMSDLLPAYELRKGHGGSFDVGGIIAVPRVDREILGPRLDLYFEVYPGDALLAAHRPLAVTYRVQSLPHAFRFRDQFTAAGRAASQRRSAVESTFEMRPRDAVERQQLSIDVGHLEPGEYVFTVEVQPYAGGTMVERSFEFEIPASARPQP